MRFYDKITLTEAIQGIHNCEGENIVVLEDDHLFFKPIPEGMKWIYTDGIPSGYETISGYYEEQLRAAWKAERAALVEAIKVTTAAGNTFDGDEISQGRMARAVVALNASPVGTTVNWILADNTVIQATSEELTEALALAGAAQAAIWVAP